MCIHNFNWLVVAEALQRSKATRRSFSLHHPIHRIFEPGKTKQGLQVGRSPALRIFTRPKVSVIHEPPLDSNILEKPCTLILLEDDSRRRQSSWQSSFESSVPTKHGMAYATLTLEGKDLEEKIAEMKVDLSSFHDAILVTRGPIASWVAMFYLESLPLNGLVAIDPIQFDDLMHANDVIGLDSCGDIEGEYPLFREASKKKLKLEPNAVPMLILDSLTGGPIGGRGRPSREECERVARRHGDENGPYGLVMVQECPANNPGAVIETIDEWVESIL